MTTDNGLAGRIVRAAVAKYERSIGAAAASVPATKQRTAPSTPRVPANNNTPAKPTASLIAVHQFQLRGTASIPRREFLYGRHHVRKFMAALFAAGGLGKTSLTASETLAMVTGKPLLGHKPERPLRVWLIGAEDPLEELERKIEATAAHFRVTDADIGGRLFLSSGRESDFTVAIEARKGVEVQAPIVEAIVQHAKANAIDVIIVDPFVSTHQVNENDNAAIQKVAATWVSIADALGCSLELAHHVTKGGGEVTEDSGRGAGALKDKARAVRVLNRMTAEEASRWGIDREDRNSYFRCDLAKANLAPSGRGSEWYRFVSVPMGNGDGLTKPQDHTGVVERWTPPTAEDTAAIKAGREAEARAALVAHVRSDQLAGIKVRLQNSGYKFDPQGKPWAGELVAEILGLDLAAEGQRGTVKEMLQAWVELGELSVSEEHDEALRKPRKFLRPAFCAT